MKRLMIALMLCLLAVSVAGAGVYEITPTGWRIYDDFTVNNTQDIYEFFGTTYIDNATSQMVCAVSGGGFYIKNESFKVDPKGQLFVRTNHSNAGTNRNAYNHWRMQNYNGTSVETLNSTTKYVAIYHRNRAGDSEGTIGLRIWNGNGTLEAVTNVWDVNGTGHGLTAGEHSYNLTVTDADKYNLKFYDGVTLEGTYTSSIFDTTTFENESDYWVAWDCREGTSESNIQLNTLEIIYIAPIPSNLPPVIVPSSPANNTDTNQNLSVQFTVTDDSNATTDCDLYVDTVLNQSNISVLNNTLTTFPMVWSQGIHTWYLECKDSENATTTTGTYNLFFDDHEPNIVSGSPSITNTTIYTGFTMNVFGNVTNLNLTNVTRIILYPNSTQFYINETTSFANATFLGWNEVFNTTLETNGVWTYSIYAEDVLQNHSHYYSFTVNNCQPSWSCNLYGSCNASDVAPCVNASDDNACGLPFGTLGELYSDFTPQACDYCDDSVTIVSTPCNAITDNQNNTYTDANFGTCCNVTGINTDCANDIVQNASVFNLIESCSIHDYDEGDLSLAMFDVIGKMILSYGFFVVIIVSIFIMTMQGVKEIWKKWFK